MKVEDMSDILVFVNKIHDVILNDKMIKELYDSIYEFVG
jgi:hypothetical protein